MTAKNQMTNPKIGRKIYNPGAKPRASFRTLKQQICSDLKGRLEKERGAEGGERR